MNTAHLLQRCRAGDAAAIETLVHSHRNAVYRFALSILNDPAEAEEAAQEAFIAALSGLDAYRGEAALGTWLYSITLNICRDRLRRGVVWERLIQRIKTLFQTSGEGLPHPEEAVLQNERDVKLWSAVQSLNEKHRVPVILYYYHDLPIAEIARIMEVSPGTILSRLHTARERLRGLLND